MLLAQITDFHVTSRGTRFFGQVDTNAYLAAAVAHLNGLSPRPDLVVMTGDLVNDAKPAEYEMLAELLAPLAMPAFAIPGNHDDRDGLRRLFGPRGYLPKTGPFLHYSLDDWPVRIIALDTQVPGHPHGELCADRLDWLAQRLAQAPDRPTVLIMHHPPFATGIRHMDAMACTCAAAFGRLVQQYGCIERILCGHVHRACTVRWQGTIASIAPSTAHQVALDLSPDSEPAWTREPPSVALHQWLPEMGLVSHLSAIGAFPATPYRARADAARR